MPRIPFNLGIDHNKKRLIMTVKAEDGEDSTANMDVNEIAEFMATLSQCQHALVLSHAGIEVNLPLDPACAFETLVEHHALDFFEVHQQHAIGIDSQLGAVSLRLLSRVGRLTSIRMSPDAARSLAEGLAKTVDEISPPQK